MSKIKKVLAVFLTLAMVMGMGLTTFAAEKSANIVIKNAGEGTFNYVKIVGADQSTRTGWEIVDDYKNAFTTAFGVNDTQVIIDGMMYSVDKNQGNEIDGFAGKYANALAAIFEKVPVGTSTSPITVNEAGVYFIKGNSTNTITYSPMAAYVAFGPYEGGVPTDLTDTEVEAKKQTSSIDKSADDKDKVVEIGRTETYNITGIVPFIPTTDENRHYWVKDEITGAEYVTGTDGTVELTVKIGSKDPMKYYGTVTPTAKGYAFAADLTNILNNNENANMSINISYQAVIKDVQVGNDVQIGDGVSDGKFGNASEKLYTGEITLTKFAEDETTVLAGAGFEVTKDDTTDALVFVKESDGVYKYAPDAKAPEAVTEVFTNDEGKVIVKGLDIGTYHFTETTAPEGYSINTKSSDATLEVDGDIAKATITATTTMNDTKLSSLPSTGGIGTTIFTIGGCLIMIIAAALFFASRRKNNK